MKKKIVIFQILAILIICFGCTARQADPTNFIKELCNYQWQVVQKPSCPPVYIFYKSGEGKIFTFDGSSDYTWKLNKNDISIQRQSGKKTYATKIYIKDGTKYLKLGSNTLRACPLP